MCGRFTRRSSPSDMAALLGLAGAPFFEPWYNIAPSQPVVAIRHQGYFRAVEWLVWGFVPHWSKEPSPSAFVNARQETAATKPAFRDAFHNRRCLIPADGFYEWRKTALPSSRIASRSMKISCSHSWACGIAGAIRAGNGSGLAQF